MTVHDTNDRVSSASHETAGGAPTAVRFYLLAFTISWVVWGSAIAWSALEDWEPLIIIAGAYGPLLGALLLPKLTGSERFPLRRLAGLRRRTRWLLVASVGPPLLIAATHVLLYPPMARTLGQVEEVGEVAVGP